MSAGYWQVAGPALPHGYAFLKDRLGSDLGPVKVVEVLPGGHDNSFCFFFNCTGRVKRQRPGGPGLGYGA